MDHLVLLQTPMHASGEIDRVIKEVRNGEMPRDDVGLRKEIDPKLPADILRTAEEFRHALAERTNGSRSGAPLSMALT
jgi:hypothetical protein